MVVQIELIYSLARLSHCLDENPAKYQSFLYLRNLCDPGK